MLLVKQFITVKATQDIFYYNHSHDYDSKNVYYFYF